MAVNYNDERFQKVDNEAQQAITNVTNMYNDMIAKSDKVYQDQIQAAENYGKQQAEIQQANTDFAIEKINQQKEQAQKDYTKEQKGAYADWQRQSNQFGVNAEQMASMGLAQSGYGESSQVSMYNTYQNRIGQARDTYNKTVLEYDNGIKDAQLANNAKLAEIAYQALSTKLELGLNQFQYNNKLLESQLSAINQERDRAYAKWQDVLAQINRENELAEQQRQFNKSIRNSYYSGGGSRGSGGYDLDDEGENNESSSGGSWFSNLKNKTSNKIGNALVAAAQMPTVKQGLKDEPLWKENKAFNSNSFKYYEKTYKNKKFTYNQLYNQLKKDLDNKKLNNAQAGEILKSYGFNTTASSFLKGSSSYTKTEEKSKAKFNKTNKTFY